MLEFQILAAQKYDGRDLRGSEEDMSYVSTSMGGSKHAYSEGFFLRVLCNPSYSLMQPLASLVHLLHIYLVTYESNHLHLGSFRSPRLIQRGIACPPSSRPSSSASCPQSYVHSRRRYSIARICPVPVSPTFARTRPFSGVR